MAQAPRRATFVGLANVRLPGPRVNSAWRGDVAELRPERASKNRYGFRGAHAVKNRHVVDDLA